MFKTLRAHLADNRGDENISKMIWVAIVFVVGAILLIILTSAFEGMLSMALKKRGLSDEAALYVDMSHMDPETGIPVPKTREQMPVGKEPPKHLEKSTESGE